MSRRSFSLLHARTPFCTAGAYIQPAVKIESGAKSALEPHYTVAVRPDISKEVSGISLEVSSVTTVVAERTFWDKVVILHGLRRWHENREFLGIRDSESRGTIMTSTA